MHLWVDSDVAYLVTPKARSRLTGHFFLSNKPTNPTKPQHNPKPNGLLHTECKLIKHVVTSSTEGEIAATYHNSQVAVNFRQRLADVGYEQTAPTPIKTDNENNANFVEGTLKQRFTKHMDMRYHWPQDRQQQKQIQVHWAPGNENMADYHTKHHHPIYHRRIHAKYVTDLANARVNALLNIKAILCVKPKTRPPCCHHPCKGVLIRPADYPSRTRDSRPMPTVTFSTDKQFTGQSTINFSN